MKEGYSDEHIEQFLLDELNEEQRIEFEKEIKRLPELNRRVQQQKEIILSIQSIERDRSTEKAVKQAAVDYFRPAQKKGRVIPFRMISLIASAAAIALFIWFIQKDGGVEALQPNQVFAEYFTPSPLLEVERSADGSTVSRLKSGAYKFYESGDWQNALRGFEGLFEKELPSAKDLNYAASAALSMTPPNVEKARSFYYTIITYDNATYVNSAKWNLALIAISEGPESFATAKAYLKEIVDSPANKYSKRAKELISRLEATE